MSIESKIKLKEQERIISAIRRYGLTFFWQWLLVAILFAVPFFFMFWLFRHDWWGMTLFFTPICLGLFFIMRILFLWKRNILIITTHRIVDIHQEGFFEQTISDVPYDQIEDVMGKIRGFFGTIFRYGNVNIQTGSGKVKIIIDRVKQPTFIQQEINEMRERYLSKYSHDFSGDVADVIIDKLYELEMPDLVRVQKALRKRVKKLDQE